MKSDALPVSPATPGLKDNGFFSWRDGVVAYTPRFPDIGLMAGNGGGRCVGSDCAKMYFVKKEAEKLAMQPEIRSSPGISIDEQ